MNQNRLLRVVFNVSDSKFIINYDFIDRSFIYETVSNHSTIGHNFFF